MSGRKKKLRAGAPARPPASGPGLSTRGAIASRFGDAGGADPLRALGVDPSRLDLGDQAIHLAEEVVACADRWAGDRDRLALTLALVVTHVAARQGSTRVPLAGAALRDLVAAIAGRGDPDQLAAEIVRVTAPALGSRGGGLVGGAGEPRPLIVDRGALYQHRLFVLERDLAARLAARVAAAPPPDAARIGDAVAAVVAAPGTVSLTEQQAAAVRTALGGRLGVVSGGPGTGKTAIIVSILRALARLGAGAIALAAPTGKAANRISESVARELAVVAEATPAGAAQTLHRLLGWRPDGGFRHSELSPLPHDAVIVDEASMVDLALMERLVRALRPDARLILLGDAHQLPSVDAGAVLADLVALARAAGAPWAIELTESHRMRQDDPDGRAILEAARAIDAGQAPRAPWRVGIADATERGVERVRVETPAQLGEVLDGWWRRTVDDPEFARLAARAYHRRGGDWGDGDRDALEALLAVHERRRLLTVTRGLDTGAVAINARLHRRMLERSTAELAPDFVPGEPVMITANDYERGLYNGDQGVVVRVVDDDGAQRFRAVFRSASRGLVPLPIDAVRATMELAWAITVHKSQGSELERIALVLPREDLPLVTRELLYTALTRARRGALVLGTDEVFAAGIGRTAARASGLAERMCTHEVILNGACLFCGATDFPPPNPRAEQLVQIRSKA